MKPIHRHFTLLIVEEKASSSILAVEQIKLQLQAAKIVRSAAE